MTWEPELDELRLRESHARRMGGAGKVARQHAGGRLTVRERIARLADPGSFRETGAIAGKARYDAEGNLIELVPSNSVFGRAEIDGEDATSTLSATGVNDRTDFICNAPSENVLVQRPVVGEYRVVFGDVAHDGKIGELFSGVGPKPKPMVTSQEAGNIVSATGPFQCAVSPPPAATCYIVHVRNESGQLDNGDFTIAIL